MVKFTELNPSESKVITLNKWGAFNFGRGATVLVYDLLPFLLPWIILVQHNAEYVYGHMVQKIPCWMANNAVEP